MNIAMVGFGKMGHMIAQAAELRGHKIVCSVDPFARDASLVTGDAASMAEGVKNSGAEGVIEFSHPASVFSNIQALIPLGLPLVVGTTGWHDRIDEVSAAVERGGGSLLYSSNFSIGVNLFYRIVSEASRLMAEFEQYDVALFESHHNQKADSPSGTALELAKRVMDGVPRKTRLVTDAFVRKPEADELHLSSVRVGSVPGTHTVWFDSAADTIELTHTARNREGFALGAVRALEWLQGPDQSGATKKGIFTMKDVFNDI